ncbi:S-M checkpoint control protein rad4 [Neolecta irregularis DAH-3]|uniref:S-M checkpoint control protein rad4 n=1 Tax=Neolecta irregularis (strain DAH-3) TaxID=1198029 RepID=A0A1U7LGQ1_NEOID|nr:S-M checkpoint control protein rad4 [Neolecta irregularis DAH-3]|eukprot:OLL21836.1 S-M checkpoint control protein rad4 [Neolecta irregularis DAH-3]
MATEFEVSKSSQPLIGVMLCCTAIPQEIRNSMFKQAVQMGAKYTNDLTIEVTHLIVGDFNTPKYKASI